MLVVERQIGERRRFFSPAEPYPCDTAFLVDGVVPDLDPGTELVMTGRLGGRFDDPTLHVDLPTVIDAAEGGSFGAGQKERGAAVLRDGHMIVRDDVDEPTAGFGQVLVEVKACGICGSDLHFAKHGATMVELIEQMRGGPDVGVSRVDLARDVFMGHEFAAEVLDVGPDTAGPAIGTLVTSVPVSYTHLLHGPSRRRRRRLSPRR